MHAPDFIDRSTNIAQPAEIRQVTPGFSTQFCRYEVSCSRCTEVIIRACFRAMRPWLRQENQSIDGRSKFIMSIWMGADIIMVRRLLIALLPLWIAAESAFAQQAGRRLGPAVSSGCDKPPCSEAGTCLGWAFRLRLMPAGSSWSAGSTIEAAGPAGR